MQGRHMSPLLRLEVITLTVNLTVVSRVVALPTAGHQLALCVSARSSSIGTSPLVARALVVQAAPQWCRCTAPLR